MNYYPSAFPLAGGGIQGSDAKGMTLRDWFAGQALIGLLHPVWETDAEAAPSKAYSLADAMLAARKDA